MATLAEAVDATETDWIVSADIPSSTDYLTVEDEVVRVRGHFPSSLDPQTRVANVPRIQVERGAGGTTAASHVDGTALGPLIPPAASGGDSGVPDPATGNVGDVPQVNAGQDAYELAAPSAGLQNVRLLEFVLLHDDPTWRGVDIKELVVFTSGQVIKDVWMHVLTPFDGSSPELALYLGPPGFGSVLQLNPASWSIDSAISVQEGVLFTADVTGTTASQHSVALSRLRTDTGQNMPIRIVDATALGALTDGAFSPTVGEARIYVELMEPA